MLSHAAALHSVAHSLPSSGAHIRFGDESELASYMANMNLNLRGVPPPSGTHLRW